MDSLKSAFNAFRRKPSVGALVNLKDKEIMSILLAWMIN